MSQHTCATDGRSNCRPCMQFETKLWDAINRYAIACGGDPGNHVHGNVSRMQAVADVGTLTAVARGPAYETAKELAQMWRDQRTAPFDLLDRLASHFAKEQS